VDEMIVSTRRDSISPASCISHDMASALRIADRIHSLGGGQVAGSGTPDELVAGKVPLALRFLASAQHRFRGGAGLAQGSENRAEGRGLRARRDPSAVSIHGL
jgi:ABC-type transporter Mla maintaining outer membrane lipid asymmetry ATPase subunit MlaF